MKKITTIAITKTPSGYLVEIEEKKTKRYETSFLDLAELREKYLSASIYIDGKLKFKPVSLTPAT